MNENQPHGRGPAAAALGLLWGVNFASLGLVAFVLLVLVPKMAAAFADFGMKLPAVTVIVLQVSQSPVLVLAGLGLIAAAEIVLVRMAGGARHAVLVVATLLEVGLVIVLACAVFLPYVELMNSLSGGNASGG
jgi:hypothetical protein